MDLGISGRTALVLGGSKGIGRQISRDFAAAGTNVIIVARSQGPIDEAVAEARAAGVRAIGISADLDDLSCYAEIQAKAKADLTEPDIAIYNRDTPPAGRFSDVDEEMLAAAYHLVAVCFSRMVRTVLPHMEAQRWGRIVTIGSGTAKQLLRDNLNFSYALANATRVGASALSKTIADEMASKGITLNTIGTGYIDTESNRAWTRENAAAAGMAYDDFRNNLINHIPVRRAGTVQDMSSLCLFLSSALSGFITGETILCDGGQSMPII
jgi:NAD(P)-dependent dehydrogenase (short-subunit alcohol dehydrogenase family)